MLQNGPRSPALGHTGFPAGPVAPARDRVKVSDGLWVRRGVGDRARGSVRPAPDDTLPGAPAAGHVGPKEGGDKAWQMCYREGIHM